MSVRKKNEELIAKRQALASAPPEKLQKRRDAGKYTARERLTMLFDEGSFVEMDAFASSQAADFGMQKKKQPGDGVITGYGRILGRKVFAASQDFMVMGGSLGKTHAQKIARCMQLALQSRVPYVSINDSGGARVEEGIDSLSGYGDIFRLNTLASGVIPQISAIMGPCAGGAAYSPAIADYIFMVENTSQMFITGPQVVKTVTGEETTYEALGGALTHTQESGVAHFRFPTEQETLAAVRRLISFLPDSNLSRSAPQHRQVAGRYLEELDTLVPDAPTRAYDMMQVIAAVADDEGFMPVHQHFAPNIIVGFARLGGRTVGIVANQPKCLAGSLDIDASDKAARFVRFCDAFNIPLVTLTDVPAFLPGVGQEKNGIIRHGAKLLYAFAEASVPKINVILRKAYGGAYIAMNSKTLGADVVFAWPTAEIAVMGPDGAAEIIFKREIAAAENPQQLKGQKTEEYREKFSTPYLAAASGYVDDVILPGETRERVMAALAMLVNKQEERPAKKHGNIPL